MGWIVWTVILVIVGVFGFGYGTLTKMNSDKAIGYSVFGVSVFVFVVITLIYCVHSVGQREVGLVYSASGAITGTKSTGWVGTAPWAHIKKANVGVQNEKFTLGVDNSAVSSDQQDIYADLSINYNLGKNGILELYKTVGPEWKSIIVDARVLQVFKEVTSTYTAAGIATHRPELREKSKERLKDELKQFDIEVTDFFVTNLDYSIEYKKSIEAKNVQVQKALEAQAKVAQSTAEANQKVAEANGEARATVIAATADATSIAARGKAIRNNPEILRLEAIEKLNPNAQLIICTGTTCPSIFPGTFGTTGANNNPTTPSG